jgi:hypothetical protein
MVAAQGIVVEGIVDCAMWIDARRSSRAEALQPYLLGLLNGMAVGSGIEFWRANGVRVSREQVYLWMDNFCQEHPLSTPFAGAVSLLNERTDGAWSRRLQVIE